MFAFADVSYTIAPTESGYSFALLNATYMHREVKCKHLINGEVLVRFLGSCEASEQYFYVGYTVGRDTVALIVKRR